MNTNKEKELQELCDRLNFTLIDFGNEPIMLEHTKQQLYVRFICNAHQKYGIQEKSAYDLKRLKRPCKYCNHSMLTLTFKEEMLDINPNIEILSEYINSETKVKCRCKIDGYEWDAWPMALLHQNTGCKICGYKKLWDTIGRKTTEDIKREMQLVNPNIEIIGEYRGAHELIKCQCRIDGRVWESYVCNLLNGSAGCPDCATRRVRDIESLSLDEVNQRLEFYGLNVKVLDGYVNNKSKVRCLCTIHNIEYVASIKTLLYNRSSACPECGQSLGETKMVQILTKLLGAVVTQYSFEDCRYINVLRFDAYDPIRNIVFEYQGQQHYYPVDFAGKGDEWAQEQFELAVLRDNIKREYCEQNNIQIIEIPYWEYDNMESFLYNKLK